MHFPKVVSVHKKMLIIFEGRHIGSGIFVYSMKADISTQRHLWIKITQGVFC